MTKISYRKLSVLGLVLMGASAVTAAILPKSNTRVHIAGHISVTSVGLAAVTCKEDNQAFVQNCDFTATGAESATTDGGPVGTSADNDGASTGVNTGTISTAINHTWVSAL